MRAVGIAPGPRLKLFSTYELCGAEYPEFKKLWSTRGLPELGLGSLRAHGQLLEIDADDLRFSLVEVERFFALRLREPLPPEALAQLHRKTEGWPAALWLASIALERHDIDADFIERFSGSNAAVASYLSEVVLAQQRPAGRRDQRVHLAVARAWSAEASALAALAASTAVALGARRHALTCVSYASSQSTFWSARK